MYADAEYAGAYARLDWTGTYFLVRRDLPDILRKHVEGRRALDFGCGTGRSTRLLRSLGFDATGVDIAGSMIAQARAIDADGDYRHFNAGVAATSTPLELYERMLSLHPNRVNPGSLWAAARAAKPS